MTDLIGDMCAPISLLVPIQAVGTQETMSGGLFISGAKLFFIDEGGTRRIITSA